MTIIDRIKFDSNFDDALVWKYPSEDIRIGAQLIVNESQEAILFKGGKALDTFSSGTHTLSTDNIPLLNKLINLPFGKKTPFTAEIWYVNKKVKRDLKWGTKGPIQVVDPVYNYPISVRSFGMWGFRIEDARNFLVQIIGNQATEIDKGYISTERVEDYFTGEISQRLSDALAKFFVEKNISIFHASAKINELSKFVLEDISREFNRFGVEIINFNVERISIPDEEKEKFQEILAKKMEIEQISGANIGQAYTTMRSFDTLDKAAENEGGSAGQMLGAGFGFGAGFGAGTPIGKQVGNNMNVESQEEKKSKDPTTKLKKLKEMFEAELITEDEFKKKKEEILNSI